MSEEELCERIFRLEQENGKLKEKVKNQQNVIDEFNKQMDLDYVDENFISIDDIKQKFGYDEDMEVSKETIYKMIDTILEEFNRLEDLEDKMYTQYISKDKIREKIKQLEKEEKITNDLFIGSVLYCQIRLLKELLGEENE